MKSTNWKLARSAALVSAFLSALFVTVYGGSNGLASQRTEVATWYYAWERIIPFVSWTVIPYMTIDAFFVAAPFFCRTRSELKIFAQRITFAILAAGTFFVLMPLTLAVERPVPTDWTAPIFKFLHGFDRPFNLFPSLHITLRTILGLHYARHTKGAWRIASNIWFSLIGLSTLFTYQHHVVDVVGGFALGVLCFYLFTESEKGSQTIPNLRVGTYYAVASLVCLTLASIFPDALILFWPALSTALVATAYLGFAPNVYRKKNGRIPLSARIILAPILIGQYLSYRWYRRESDAWNKVTPTVWIGAKLTKSEARHAQRSGVTAVLDMTAEFSETKSFLHSHYLNLPVIDLTAPTQEQLKRAADFITAESKRGIVFVHCKAGYSRSAAAVGAYLLASGKANCCREAELLLRGARPNIVIRPEIKIALEQFAKCPHLELILTP